MASPCMTSCFFAAANPPRRYIEMPRRWLAAPLFAAAGAPVASAAAAPFEKHVEHWNEDKALARWSQWVRVTIRGSGYEM